METFARCRRADITVLACFPQVACLRYLKFLCVCVRLARTCLMLLIYTFLISINESNCIPFVISASFNSLQFKETLLVGKHETKY